MKKNQNNNTKEILQYLRKHEKVQYTNFNLNISVPTLNKRLRKLLKFNLIEHCITKELKRKEWYEITEKGKRVKDHGGHDKAGRKVIHQL